MIFRTVIISDKNKCVETWIRSAGLARHFQICHFSRTKSFINSGNEQVDVIYIVKDEPPKPLIAALHKQFPETRIIVISNNGHKTAVIGALQAGADGYILKNTSQENINYLLRQLLSGNSIVSPEHIRQLVEYIRQDERQSLAKHPATSVWRHRFSCYETDHFQFVNPSLVS